jgi:beta-carotene 15,15'-dioxygenase
MTKPECIRWLIGSMALTALYFIHPFTSTLVALALVFVIGLPHGAADAWRIRQHWPKLLTSMGIMLLYAVVAFCFGYFFYAFPLIGLIIFIVISAWHFGAYDQHPAVPWSRLAAGSIFIFGPFLIWGAAIDAYFSALGIEASQRNLLLQTGNYIFISIVAIMLLAAGTVFKHDKKPMLGLLLSLPVAIGLPPLLSFSLYFSLLHAPRQSVTLSEELPHWWKHPAILFTLLLTWVLAIAWFYFSATAGVSEPLAVIIIIGMAALTVPHMLLDALLTKKFSAAKLLLKNG